MIDDVRICLNSIMYTSTRLNFYEKISCKKFNSYLPSIFHSIDPNTHRSKITLSMNGYFMQNKLLCKLFFFLSFGVDLFIKQFVASPMPICISLHNGLIVIRFAKHKSSHYNWNKRNHRSEAVQRYH